MHPYLNKNINVQIISFVIPLYMNNQKEIDGYNRNARVGKAQIDTQLVVSPSAKATWNPSAGNSPPGGSETKGGRHRDKKSNESNGEGKAVEKVKHQEKYERHVKWELAMEIELYFT